jgi:hypothetical protein
VDHVIETTMMALAGKRRFDNAVFDIESGLDAGVVVFPADKTRF